MELIDYTNKWVTGEIQEDLAMIAGGTICLLLALVAWRWGTSESARAIILPLTVVAVILIALGGSLAYSNHTSQKQFVEQYQQSDARPRRSGYGAGRSSGPSTRFTSPKPYSLFLKYFFGILPHHLGGCYSPC